MSDSWAFRQVLCLIRVQTNNMSAAKDTGGERHNANPPSVLFHHSSRPPAH